MGRSFAALPLVLLAALAGCPKGGGGAAPDAAIAAVDAGADASAGEAAPDDEIRAVYPTDAGPPDPLVRKLCGTLHDFPEQQRATCCNTTPGLVLTSECTRTLTAAVVSRAVTIAAADVDACTMAIQTVYDGCVWVGPFPPEVPTACLGVVKGKLAAGKRCRSSLECADGMRCHGAGPTTVGKCGVGSADGEKCGGSADALAGYVRQNDIDVRHPECKGWCNRTKCAAKVPAGGPCSLGSACGEGMLCVTGKCTEAVPAAVGQPCPGDACANGALCIKGMCVAKKAVGAACTNDFECLGGCIKSDAGKSVCGAKCNAR